MSNEPSMGARARELAAYRTANPDSNLPNTNLYPTFLSCDESCRILDLAYTIHPWMKNPMGVLHGGVAGILVDNAMGIACYAVCGDFTPTITMNINYLHPVPLDSTVTVRARVLSHGRTMAYASAEIFLPDQPERILITATGVYSTKHIKK